MGDFEEQELDLNWVCCLLEDIPATCCDAFSLDSSFLSPIPTDYPFVSPNSLCKNNSKDSCGTSDGLDNCCQKRVRGGSSCALSSSKACREKLRRDHVNERFLELSAILEPGKPPKLDKATILIDATRMVKMLHDEINTLKSRNVELKQKTNELKAEKNKLRSEKLRLKVKKDRIEQRIKTLGIPHSMKLLPSPYVIPKIMPVFGYPAVPMWNFTAHASLNTSKDHALHPPVA